MVFQNHAKQETNSCQTPVRLNMKVWSLLEICGWARSCTMAALIRTIRQIGEAFRYG